MHSVESRRPARVLALGLLPGRSRAAVRAIRALRRLLPEAILRYPPATALAMLGTLLGDPVEARETALPGSGAWVAGSDALLVPELAAALLPTICCALETGIPVLAREDDPGRDLLGYAGVWVPPDGGWTGFLEVLERLERDPSERERIVRRSRVQAKHLRHLEKPELGPARAAVEARHVAVPARPFPFRPATSPRADWRDLPFRRLSVVLALHGGRALTEQCLATLRADLVDLEPGQSAEILCVDNASPDDTREWLRRQPDLHLVLLEENRGCAGGWNAGLRAATGDVLCVLNNDTLIHPGGVRALARAAWETGIAAMAGGVLNGRLEFVRMTADQEEADYPDGCALAFRREVFHAVGEFDEGMGLGYCEDSDWGLRARSRGFHFALVPGILTHLGGQTAQRLPEIGATQARNQQRLRERWQGLGVGERLLVRRTGALGDVLMATPALASLRHQKPLARLYLQCADSIAVLLRELPFLDGVGGDEPRGCTGRFDLDGAYERHQQEGEWRHPVLAYAEVLDVPVWVEPYSLPEVPELTDWAALMLPAESAEEGAGSPRYVACGLRSAGRPKANWGEDHWRALAQAAPELTWVLFDSEPRPGLEVRGQHAGLSLYDLPNVLDLTGRTPTLRHLAALLRRCRACVSVDTGLFHLATATGLPTVAPMGGTPGWARAPLVGRVELLQGVAPCYPCLCRSHCDREDGPHCLAGIAPDRVLRALRRLAPSLWPAREAKEPWPRVASLDIISVPSGARGAPPLSQPSTLITPGQGTYELGGRILAALAGPEAVSRSVVDLGCGTGAHTSGLPCRDRLFVDLVNRGAPEPFLLMDLQEVERHFAPGSFDLVCCLDAIEHLERDAGLKLIDDAERLACWRVVFFAPLGPLWLGDAEGPEGHHSAWEPADFSVRGYQTWVFPEFHRFPDGTVHGAFWAWKTLSGAELAPAELRARIGDDRAAGAAQPEEGDNRPEPPQFERKV